MQSHRLELCEQAPRLEEFSMKSIYMSYLETERLQYVLNRDFYILHLWVFIAAIISH